MVRFVFNRSCSAGLALLVALTTACSSDSDGNSSRPDATPSGAGGSPGADSDNTGGSANNRDCVAQTPVLLATIAAYTDELTVHGDSVFFIDSGPEYRVPDRIRRVAVDGSVDEIVHVAELGFLDFLNLSLALDEAHVYYAHAPGLLRVPVGGGRPEQVTLPDTDVKADDALVAADNESVYLLRRPGSLLRISVADGSETLIAQSDDAMYDVQVFDDHIWYKPGFLGTDGVYKTPMAAVDPSEATQVSSAACGFYRMSVTSEGIFCSGNFSVARHGFENEEPTTVWVPAQPGGKDVSGPAGDYVYLYPSEGSNDPTIYRLPVAGGEATPIACDRGWVAKMGFTDDAVVWLEVTGEGGSEVTGIYTVPK